MKATWMIGLTGLTGLTSAWALACPTGLKTAQFRDTQACILSAGTYANDITLTSNFDYILSGAVFIAEGASLTIEPGTTIYGESSADYLVINRGAKIFADGKGNAPIVFTSTSQKRGAWGGLIINGKAPINTCSTGVCEAEGEGSTGVYGGSDPQDSSGSLTYVRVEYAGYEITPDNELNGIAFQGVGAGTRVENIQVHMAADDGLEFFGGTVDVRNVVITGALDDSLDWVQGWQGRGQYILIKQYDDKANNGIEADNLKSPTNATPRSAPELANVTLIGSDSAQVKGGEGILLRRGTGLRLYNSIITGFKKSCIDIDGSETFANGSSIKSDGLTGIYFGNIILDCSTTFNEQKDGADRDPYLISEELAAETRVGRALLSAGGYIPANNSPALDFDATVVPSDFFFDEVDFAGAVRDTMSDWTAGWTVGL